MHYMVAIAASVLALAPGPRVSSVHKVADVSDITEVYVAQLDADWTVAKDIRVPCSIDLGCSVDLGLTGSKLARVRVQLDPLRDGQIAVTSATEDQAGHAMRQPDLTLRLDRTGFGADHYEAGPVKAAVHDVPGAAGDPPIILVAVKVPAWAVPVGSLSSGGDRT